MCNKIRQTCVSKVIVSCVTPIVPESFMIVQYQVSMSWCDCSKMSEVLAGAHMILCVFSFPGVVSLAIKQNMANP